MAISTVSQKGLDAPLTLTSPVLTTPNLGTPSALVLTNATGLPSGALPAGCILQVIQAGSTSAFSTSSTSYVATAHTASITPKSATSKIFILYNGNWCIQAANTEVGVTIRSNQGASNLGYGTFYSATASGYTCTTLGITYLDSPATTSALTYTIYVKESGVPGTISTGAEYKTLTLMEVAA